MKLTRSLNDSHDPQLYLRLGELVSSAGDNAFADRMLAFVYGYVPIHGLDLSEWVIDAQQRSISQIKCLGNAGPQHHIPVLDNLPPPLLESVICMEAPLLIQLKTPTGWQHPRRSAHQCNVVSNNGDRRWLISFHRQTSLRAFSLAELSLLKSLSDTLLPLVEQHAQLLAQPAAGDSGALRTGSDGRGLHQAFSGRLMQDDVSLSAREQEVCLGLLTGVTVPEMAQRLNVKNSSVETYLKRATAKLGISGRHGLARWMASA